MRIGIFLLLTGILPLAAHAQLNTAAERELNMRQLATMGPLSPGAFGFDDRYEGVRGSPYLFDNWQDGAVLIRGNSQPNENMKININQERHLLLVQFADGTVGNVPAGRIEQVAVTTPAGVRRFRALPPAFIEGGAGGDGERFYEVLHDGNFLLLKGYKKIFQKANYKDAYSPDQRYDQYLDQERYFLRMPKGGFESFSKLKPRAVEKALPGYEKDVSRLVRDQSLDLFQEAHLIRLLQGLEEKG